MTGIYIGETAGTFNPADHTWQAVSTGIFMETNRFLQTASTEAGRNKLTQLNIPAFEVGRTNLSGSLIDGDPGSFDFMSVSMNNVAFFAPSTGQKPGIWATNSVTGQYDFSHGFINSGNITNAENVIALSNGSGISADFQFKNWNSSNNTWSASVKMAQGTSAEVRITVLSISKVPRQGHIRVRMQAPSPAQAPGWRGRRMMMKRIPAHIYLVSFFCIFFILLPAVSFGSPWAYSILDNGGATTQPRYRPLH